MHCVVPNIVAGRARVVRGGGGGGGVLALLDEDRFIKE